jgi:hypothetical protein
MGSKLKLRLFKSKKLKNFSVDDIKLLVDFLQFASEFLEYEDSYKITLLESSPDMPITLGSYQPGKKHIHVIVQNRNPLDYFRTISHEMVHQKQEHEGRLTGKIPEIGGEIEDQANYMAGRIMKSYIKNHLDSETKKRLGLGTF